MGGSGEGDVQTTKTSGRDLGDVNPADLSGVLVKYQILMFTTGKLTGPQPH